MFCLLVSFLKHCFLVGWCTNKSYVIATSDLWLFIHASNLLPLNSPSPLPYKLLPSTCTTSSESLPLLSRQVLGHFCSSSNQYTSLLFLKHSNTDNRYHITWQTIYLLHVHSHHHSWSPYVDVHINHLPQVGYHKSWHNVVPSHFRLITSEQIHRILAACNSNCSFTGHIFEYPPKWCTYSTVSLLHC